MAIKSWLERLEISSPKNHIKNDNNTIKDKFTEFKNTLFDLTDYKE
jgi:hypothetical protein